MTVETRQHQRWELPPLVLHPFTNGTDASVVFESIRLNLAALSGQRPDADLGEAQQKMLYGKYCEFRMLCFIGKDLVRWLRQCADFAQRDARLASSAINEQSFSDLLVYRTPPAVAARFESWGVSDYRRILRRAIGVNSVFPHPPEYAVLASGFLEHYCSYADTLFICFQGLTDFRKLEPGDFSFSLFTSGEYINAIEGGLGAEPGEDSPPR